MSPEIFSFLQTQVSVQPQQFLPGLMPQENTGTMPGIFDALVAEYSLEENTDSLQAHTQASPQPLPFRNDAAFSGRMTDIIAGGNSQADSTPQEAEQPVTEKLLSWQNLFADVKRNSEVTPKRHENFVPQNDFDDGIIADSSQFDVHVPKDVANDSHSDNVTENTEPITLQPEIPEQIPHKPELTANAEREILQLSTENAKPAIIESFLPENDTPNSNVAEKREVLPTNSETEDTNPEITTPSQHDDVAIPRKTSADDTAPENTINIPAPETTPENNEPPAKLPEVRNVPRKSHAITAREPEPHENSEIPADEPSPEFSRSDKPSIAPEIAPAGENADDENQTPVQDSNVQNEAESRKITESLTNDSPRISKDNQPTKETPEVGHEISGTHNIMAGFSAVQAADPEMKRPEISEPPETVSKPRIVRAQNHLQEKSQALTHEAENVIAETESLTEDSRITTPISSRTTQSQSGHDETAEPEMNQPSETQSVSERSAGRVAPQPAGNSRTTQRTESRNDTRRTEALSDFQTFFDSAVRTRRSPARVSTQPLSLRTGTYEVAAARTQSQTLRNGIVNTVRFIRADGVRKANIIVDPPALGRISVELTSSNSGVEASVKVANEQIRQIVQDQFTQLRDNLLQQGVQVSEITVDVQQDSSRQGQDSGGQNQRDNYAFTPSDDDDDTENFRADLEEGLLYWIA